MTYKTETGRIHADARAYHNAASMAHAKLTYLNPEFRTWHLTAKTSLLHDIQFVPLTEAEREAMIDFVEQHDAWFDYIHCNEGEYHAGTIAQVYGGHKFYNIKTPHKSVAMLFKLTFGGSA